MSHPYGRLACIQTKPIRVVRGCVTSGDLDRASTTLRGEATCAKVVRLNFSLDFFWGGGGFLGWGGSSILPVGPSIYRAVGFAS